MKVVIWARVSSREQREGYSIDAQLRACRLRAEREGWAVVREFAVAESAKRGAERLAFNDGPKTGDPRRAIFEPHAERRNSLSTKEKAVQPPRRTASRTVRSE